MPRVRVRAGGRLHFGFCNLSLAHERLYGGLGATLSDPTLEVTADRTDDAIDCEDDVVESVTDRAVDMLGVNGARVRVDRSLPRHAGLGSGTQLALAVLAAVARAHDRTVDPRALAPELGRGGRSGVGVAAFETGGFVLDAGHPTARFTTSRPADGDWNVPPVAAHHSIPAEFRFLVVVPDVEPGRSGEAEDASMRTIVENADPTVSDRIAGVLVRRLLPAIADGSARRFGEAVAEIGRLNGTWYADEQGGVYRPPVGDLVAALSDSAAVFGAGQSSWGPAVYGVTDADRAEAAETAGRDALDAAGLAGTVLVAGSRNRGATVEADARE